jgi:N-acetylmuramoyl-L-alanine amidase
VLTLAACLLLSGYGDLEDLARSRDVHWSCEAATGRHTLRAGTSTIVFMPGLSSALVNSSPFALSSPVTLEGGRVKLPPELTRLIEMSGPRRGYTSNTPVSKDLKPPPAREPERKPRGSTLLAGVKIAIDPGHGGFHTGGTGQTGLMEKDINLRVSLQLQQVLESWGAQVVMTRTADRHFSKEVDDDLDERVAIVNGCKPDLFLSIHTNFATTAGPRGYEVWVPRCSGHRDTESRNLAGLLRGELGTVWDSPDRGTKDEHNLRVLKGTRCPAALVELEFVSNPAAERLLARTDKQADLAAAIAEAARKWFGR